MEGRDWGCKQVSTLFCMVAAILGEAVGRLGNREGGLLSKALTAYMALWPQPPPKDAANMPVSPVPPDPSKPPPMPPELGTSRTPRCSPIVESRFFASGWELRTAL